MAPRTGVICTRSSWPDRVAVTNCALGLALPRKQALLDAFQRMGDEPAIEDGIDGTSESDELRAARELRGLGQRAELAPCTVVVEQDAAVEVADHHALGQLAHQRGQPVALLLDAPARALDLLADVLPELVALARKIVDHLRQSAEGGLAAPGGEIVPQLVRQQAAGALQQARRRDQPAPEQRPRGEHRGGDDRERGESQQRRARDERPRDVGSLAVRQRRPHERPRRRGKDREQRRGRQRRDRQSREEPAIALHAPAGDRPRRSRTFCTSSLVENGLVM